MGFVCVVIFSVTNAVLHISGLGIVPEVDETVIRRTIVKMAGLHPLGTRTDESQENKAVNPSHGSHAGTIQIDYQVSTTFNPGRHDAFVEAVSATISARQGLDPPKIANLIQPFPSRYR
ncbi:HNH endonuclease [Rathayibacter phage NCPPB3778]|nr:HNH endonuclease [Rathayibacter phage NCPPB3778]